MTGTERLHIAALAALGLLLAAMTIAHATTGAEVQVGPCVKELHAYCGSVEMGEGRQLNCLRQHAAQASPVCRKKLIRKGLIDPAER